MAPSDHIVPPEHRSAQLKEQVLKLVDAVVRHMDKNPPTDQESFPFVRLISPWLVDLSTFDETQREAAELYKSRARASGFDGDEHSAVVKGILATDAHLRACCRTALTLAFFLERSIITLAVQLRRQRGSNEEINFIYSRFEALTYHQDQYSRTAYTHIFNLRIESEEIDLGRGKKLRQVHESVIPTLLGEPPSSRSFLHPSETGNVFLSETQAGDSVVSDDEWLNAIRLNAHEVVTVLQYLKDGVVNVGYSVLDFNPPWVNELRKFGLVFVGDPRRLPYKGGTDWYQLDAEGLHRLNRWQAALSLDQVKARMGASNLQMRLTIERAGTYYEGSHDRTQPDERLISLSIALESLFSPTDQSELSFRICQSASLLLGSDAGERLAIFASFREMYKLRSKLIHGNYDVQRYKNATFVYERQLREWADIIRRAILSFIILFLRGCDNKGDLHARLEKASFDEAEGAALRKESDVETFLGEMGI
jgi:hypothetical protein